MIPVSRETVVKSSLTFLGTPWMHGARIKNVGIDCTGLIILSFNESGAKIEDFFDYSMFDEFTKLVRLLNAYCNRKEGKILPGDILLFRGDDMFNHVGLAVSETEFIHAYSVPSVMRVVTQQYNSYWKQRLKGVYSYKGFEN